MNTSGQCLLVGNIVVSENTKRVDNYFILPHSSMAGMDRNDSFVSSKINASVWILCAT